VQTHEHESSSSTPMSTRQNQALYRISAFVYVLATICHVVGAVPLEEVPVHSLFSSEVQLLPVQIKASWKLPVWQLQSNQK
jgi:hypothetical protein